MPTTVADVDHAFRTLRAAWARADLHTWTADGTRLDAANLVLASGSPTYGRAWRLHYRHPVTGGLHNATAYGDLLGMTRREAELSLRAMAAGIEETYACRTRES